VAITTTKVPVEVVKFLHDVTISVADAATEAVFDDGKPVSPMHCTVYLDGAKVPLCQEAETGLHGHVKCARWVAPDAGEVKQRRYSGWVEVYAFRDGNAPDLEIAANRMFRDWDAYCDGMDGSWY